MKDDRYQHQSWYVRLWRRRWYLLIPWYAWRHRGAPQVWSLAKSLAQYRMKWYYSMEEVFGALFEEDVE